MELSNKTFPNIISLVVDLANILVYTKSMTTIVNIHKAKTNLSELIQRAESGEEIIIARDGNPVVKMIRLVRNKGKRPAPGIDSGKINIHPDFDDPLSEFDLE
jgi:antitoxin (DNA-binding transcriptional repressor) of toxin-antitoxin stability system